MPGVIAVPEVITSAATDLATIVSNLSAAHAVATLPTSAVLSAVSDEVSTGVAHLFSQYARDYQALAGQATAFHDQFVEHLTASARAYAGAEATNAGSLQPLNSVADSIGGLGNQAVGFFDSVHSQVLNWINHVEDVLANVFIGLIVLLFVAFIIAIILLIALQQAVYSYIPG